MASQADKRGLALLSTANGHLIYAIGTRKLGKMIEDLALDVINKISYAQKNWPGKYTKAELQKLEDTINEWGVHIDEHTEEVNKLMVMFSIATHCLADVADITKSAEKKRLIKPIFPALAKLEEKFDPLGNKYQDYEKAREIRGKLYTLLGFPEEYI